MSWTPPDKLHNCVVGRLTDLAIVTGTDTDVPWDDEKADNANMHDGANPERITVKEKGRYAVEFFLRLQNMSGTVEAAILDQSGNVKAGVRVEAPASGQVWITVTHVEQVGVGDWFKARVFHDHGSNRDLKTASRFRVVQLA